MHVHDPPKKPIIALKCCLKNALSFLWIGSKRQNSPSLKKCTLICEGHQNLMHNDAHSFFFSEVCWESSNLNPNTISVNPGNPNTISWMVFPQRLTVFSGAYSNDIWLPGSGQFKMDQNISKWCQLDTCGYIRHLVTSWSRSILIIPDLRLPTTSNPVGPQMASRAARNHLPNTCTERKYSGNNLSKLSCVYILFFSCEEPSRNIC